MSSVIRPMVNRDSAYFWEGTARGQLRIQSCNACGALRVHGNPRYVLRRRSACSAASWVQLAALECQLLCGPGPRPAPQASKPVRRKRRMH